MKATIATSITTVKNSETHSHRKKCPISGSAKCASKSWPNAVTRVKNKQPKPTNTNQCATPTNVHWSIRVWPRVSLSIVTVREPGLSVRATGWPTLITPMMVRIARTNRAMPTAAMARETTMAKICMERVLLVRLSRRPVPRALPEPIAAYVAASVPGPVG